MQKDSTIKERGTLGKREGQRVALNLDPEIFMVACSNGDF